MRTLLQRCSNCLKRRTTLKCRACGGAVCNECIGTFTPQGARICKACIAMIETPKVVNDADQAEAEAVTPGVE